jgi:hypothetical protein
MMASSWERGCAQLSARLVPARLRTRFGRRLLVVVANALAVATIAGALLNSGDLAANRPSPCRVIW